MTARTRRTRTLQLGTALATTLFAGGLGSPAFGQTAIVPTGNTTVAGGATVAPGTPTPTGGNSLDVNLNDTNSVVTWTTYSVGADNRIGISLRQFADGDAIFERSLEHGTVLPARAIAGAGRTGNEHFWQGPKRSVSPIVR